MDALEKCIEYCNRITNIAFVGYYKNDETDEVEEVIEELKPEDVKEINRLAYKVSGYLLALKLILEADKDTIEDMEKGRFNFNLLKI